MPYILLIIAIIALDRLIKHLVVLNLATGDSIPIIEGLIHITHVDNDGVAFSMFSGSGAVLIVLPLIVVAAGLVILIKQRKAWHPALLVSIAMIIAGGIGNLIDRVTQGYVVDFIDFRVFPVFNVADIAVTCGCILMIIYMLFIDRHKHD